MLTLLSPPDAQTVRDFLCTTGYTDTEFRSRPGLRDLGPASRLYLLEYVREPNRLNVLLRLLLFGLKVEQKTVASVVPPSILQILLQARIVTSEGDWLVPSVMLTPLDGFWFAADPMGRLLSEDSGDIVLWANPTTRILNLFSIRRRVSEALDLGSGCGVLSVLASPYSERVTATDLNPRAETFTRFNASLNGAENIECFTGDTYETVKDRTFDLILANPPFFVTPSSTQMFCENPMALDGYCRRVVREGASRLAEGGYLQMTFEWVQIHGQSWQDRVAEWLEGTGCDAWVLRSYVRDPAAYAQDRIRDEFAHSPEKARQKFNGWLAYYRENGVEQICGGMLVMRRRSAANWLRIEELPLDVGEPVGDQVEQVFGTQTLLSQHPSDAQLLALKPRLAPEARLEQQLRQSGTKWAPASLRLAISKGLPGTIAVEWPVAEFLARCDGTRTLEALVRETATAASAPVDQVVAQCSAVVRKLAERRFLAL